MVPLEGLEKQLEVNATWRRVFSIEASTANLKLSDDETRKRNNEESKRSLAELDVVRCSFRVNRLEEKLCEMRSREIMSEGHCYHELPMNSIPMSSLP